MNQYLQIFLIIFSVQLVFFLFASLFKTDKFTDLAYGLTFVIVSIYLLIVNQSYLVQHLIMAMITLWGVRLAGYLFIRILKIKKDKRFDGIRENFFKFGSFWLLQSIAIFVIMLPSIIILISQKDYFFTTLSYIGILMWYFGFKIETVADKQKFKFKNDPKNKGKFIKSGLWSLSRHPNYFGELLVWWGLYIFVLPYLFGIEYLSIIGPIFITVLLLFGTGIPTLEKKYDERYKNDKDYQGYKKNTPILIPFIK